MILKIFVFVFLFSLINCQDVQEKYYQDGMMFCLPFYLQKDLALLFENVNNTLVLNVKSSDEMMNLNENNSSSIEKLRRQSLPFVQELSHRFNNSSNIKNLNNQRIQINGVQNKKIATDMTIKSNVSDGLIDKPNINFVADKKEIAFLNKTSSMQNSEVKSNSKINEAMLNATARSDKIDLKTKLKIKEEKSNLDIMLENKNLASLSMVQNMSSQFNETDLKSILENNYVSNKIKSDSKSGIDVQMNKKNISLFTTNYLNLESTTSMSTNLENSSVPFLNLTGLALNSNVEVNTLNNTLMNQTRRDVMSNQFKNRQSSLIGQLINFIPSVMHSPNSNLGNLTSQNLTKSTIKSSINKESINKQIVVPTESVLMSTTTMTAKTTTTTTETTTTEKKPSLTKEETEQQKIFEEFFGSRQNPSLSNKLLSSIKNRIGLGNKNYKEPELNLKQNDTKKLKEPLNLSNKQDVQYIDLGSIHSKLIENQENKKLEDKIGAHKINENFEAGSNDHIDYKESNNLQYTEYNPKKDYLEDNSLDLNKLTKNHNTPSPLLKDLISSYRNGPSIYSSVKIPGAINILPYANMLETGLSNLRRYRPFKPPYQNEKTGYNYPLYGYYRE